MVIGVGLAAWLLRRFSGTEEIDRSLLAGKATGPPSDVSVAGPEQGEESGGLEDLLEPGQTLAISSHGEVFLPYGGQVHVLPLGEVRERIAAGVVSWESVRREVVEALQMTAMTGRGTQLKAGDFTGGRVKRGAPDVDPWRLELLGREGEYVVSVFETQEGAKTALAMLEESEVIRRPLDDDGRPIPASTEDFEEARRRFEETITELSEDDETSGGGSGPRARAGEEPPAMQGGDPEAAVRGDGLPRAEIEGSAITAVADQAGEIPEPEPAAAAPEEPIDPGQLAAESEASSDLPAPEAQEWTIGRLADLIRSAGPDPFLCAPLILPNDTFFPDRWQGDAASVGRLTDRVLDYARIDPSAEDAQAGTAIGVTSDQLAVPEVLVAALAHAAARVWRVRHDLAGPPSRAEEALADLTTLYLGFGILTANAAYRGQVSGNGAGYLSSQSACFLLALQAVVCDIPYGRYKRWLDATQGVFFDAATRELEPRLDELIERLGLPPEDQWPEPWEPVARAR